MAQWQATLDKQQKEREAADLDEDAAKRRQRVALWQEQRRAAEQAEDAERKKQEVAAETWTLEDDMENELGQVSICSQSLHSSLLMPLKLHQDKERNGQCAASCKRLKCCQILNNGEAGRCHGGLSKLEYHM